MSASEPRKHHIVPGSAAGRAATRAGFVTIGRSDQGDHGAVDVRECRTCRTTVLTVALSPRPATCELNAYNRRIE